MRQRIHPARAYRSAGKSRSSVSGSLPLSSLAVGAVAVLLCFSIVGWGLFHFAWAAFDVRAAVVAAPKSVPPPPARPVAPPPPLPKGASLAERLTREVSDQRRRLDEIQQRGLTLSQTVKETEERRAGLQREVSQLTAHIEERQAALSSARSTVARLTQEQEEAQQQRLASLRNQALDLEKRVKDLEAALARTRLEREEAERLAKGPQVVECVADGIVLKPQQTHIPTAKIGGSIFARLAGEHGVYFVVRPNGFQSFREARSIAKATNGIVGYEPSRGETL